jgi:hypothetical protein
MLTSIVFAAVMSATMVDPSRGEQVESHGSPGTFTQPVVRRYERFGIDNSRRTAWDRYCVELDELWREFREAGSTPAAFRTYMDKANRLKSRYVHDDPYLMPVLP